MTSGRLFHMTELYNLEPCLSFHAILFNWYIQAITGGALEKQVFLKTLRISQENTCFRASFCR